LAANRVKEAYMAEKTASQKKKEAVEAEKQKK